MKVLTFLVNIETENEVFNNMFSVYAKYGHNAFYILKPKVMEDIMEFVGIINNNVYIVFYDKYMCIGCEQMRNLFDAVVNVSVEEQGKDMTMAADIIQKARDILIHIESQ